jgi:hypothetical protein
MGYCLANAVQSREVTARIMSGEALTSPLLGNLDHTLVPRDLIDEYHFSIFALTWQRPRLFDGIAVNRLSLKLNRPPL